MKFTDLSDREQMSYRAQCRTLCQALTTIDADIDFQAVDYPAAMTFDNGDTRIIVNQAMPVDAIAGLIIHECGHVLATDSPAFFKIAKKCEGETSSYINIVEDYRTTYGVIATYFPWCMQYISQMVNELTIEHPPAVDMPSNIVNVLFNQLLPHGADPKMLADAHAYVETWGSAILSAPDTASLEAAALALEKLDQKHGKQQPPVEEKESEEEQERMQQVYGSAAEEIQQLAKEMAMAHGKSEEDSEKEAKAKAPGKSGKKPQRGSTPYSSSSDSRDFSLSPIHDQQGGFIAALSHLSGMRNRLHDAVMSSDYGAPQRYTKKGQLDCRRIAYATVTDSVFQQPFHMKHKANTAIDVVIDCSGSMSSGVTSTLARAHIAAATAFMLGSALSRIDGTHVGVLLFDDGVKRMHEVQPMRGINHDKGAKWGNAGGGTNTEHAVTQSVRDLLAARSPKRRISLVITDDMAASQDQIDACSRLGVEVYCLCIASSQKDTENVKNCTDVAKLPGMVADLVSSMLANSRRQWVA